MSDDREYLTEEEARHLWQRAAQLQAEAAARAEALGGGQEGDEESAETPAEAPGPSDGYPLTHVRAAALEAGIGPEFVDAALSEARAERLVPVDAAAKHPFARWILGHPDPTVTVHRLIRAAPRRVLDAMEAILPNDPFHLTLVDRRSDPLAGGVLTFEIQSQGMGAIGRGGFAADLRIKSDISKIHVTLTPTAGGSATALTVSGPVADAWPVSAGISMVLTAVGAGLGAAAGYAGVALLIPTLLTIGVITIVLAGLGGTAAGLTLSRAIDRYGQSKDHHALNTLASAVAAEAEGGWFAPSDLHAPESEGGASSQVAPPLEGDGH